MDLQVLHRKSFLKKNIPKHVRINEMIMFPSYILKRHLGFMTVG